MRIWRKNLYFGKINRPVTVVPIILFLNIPKSHEFIYIKKLILVKLFALKQHPIYLKIARSIPEFLNTSILLLQGFSSLDLLEAFLLLSTYLSQIIYQF